MEQLTSLPAVIITQGIKYRMLRGFERVRKGDVVTAVMNARYVRANSNANGFISVAIKHINTTAAYHRSFGLAIYRPTPGTPPAK